MKVNGIDLEELERLAKAATSGPWKYQKLYGHNNAERGWEVIEPRDGRYFGVAEMSSFNNLEPDAEFIAAANPGVVLQLIECIRDLWT